MRKADFHNIVESVLTIGLAHLSAAATKFLSGLAGKSIANVIKRCKEQRENAAKAEAASLIREVELAKSVQKTIEERVTSSFHYLRLQSEDMEHLLSLETDPFVKEELTELILTSRLSSANVVTIWLKQQPGLQTKAEQLSRLAQILVDSIDKAFAGSEEGFRLLSMLSNRATAAEFSKVGGQLEALAASTEQNVGVLQETFKVVSEIRRNQFLSPSRTAVDDRAQNAITTQNDRRFERAKEQLLHGSVLLAESAFRELIQDLESEPETTNLMLLFRSCSNLASCLWERRQFPAASEMYQKAISLLPADWRSKRHLALIRWAEGQKEAALELFTGLMEERPNEDEHVCNAASILASLGKPSAAMSLLNGTPFERANYYSTLALVHNELHDYGQAEAAARSAVKLEPGCVPSRIALVSSIALPIIRARTEKRTLHVFPTPDERVRLSEAAAIGEAVAMQLREQSRSNALYDTLVNLPPVYLMLGAVEKAAIIGKELITFAPEDYGVLTNLWCAQMRLKNFREASRIGAKLYEVFPRPETWERKVDPLILLGESSKVVQMWETDSERDKTLGTSPELLCTVAEALAKNHDSAKGLSIIEKGILAHGKSAIFLAALGAIHENLGDLTKAAAAYEEAEQCVNTENRAQILADCGFFYYRHNDWVAAAEKFATLGAATIHNPLFQPYVIAIFNSKRYKECLTLCERALSENPDGPDHIFLLAARCHFISADLPRSKDLLDTLVSRGGPEEFEHRKMLAHVYWKLDEPEKGFDVAKKALPLSNGEPECLILLSAFATRLKRHQEACEYACSAVNASPNNLRARMALIRSVFASPSETQFSPNVQNAHFESLAYLEKSGTGVLQTIPIDSDLTALRQMVRERHQRVKHMQDVFRTEFLPIGVLAKQFGRSEFEVWAGLLEPGHPPVKMQSGEASDQQRQEQAAAFADSVVIDLFGLFSLKLLDLLHLLPLLFKKIVVHSSSLEVVVEALRDLDEHPSQGSLAYSEGGLRFAERSQAETKRLTEFLRTIREFIKSPPINLVGLLPESVEQKGPKELIAAFGAPSVLPVILAFETGSSLFSDDSAVRSIAQAEYGIRGFSTQAVLRLSARKSFLSEHTYEKAIMSLLKHNYWFVSEGEGTLRAAYEESQGKLTDFGRKLLQRVSDPRINARSCLPSLARFAIFLWHSPASGSGDLKAVWLNTLWEGIIRAHDNYSLLFELITLLAGYCLNLPGTYFGLCHWAEVNVPFISQRRAVFRAMATSKAVVARRILRQNFEQWPALNGQWADHMHLRSALTCLK